MEDRMRILLSFVLSTAVLGARAYTSYANDFIDPSIILSKDFSNITIEAQETVIEWADLLASQGPWSTYRPLHTIPLYLPWSLRGAPATIS